MTTPAGGYTGAMGFYYGSNTPPEDEDKPGGIKDALYITLAVFQALALPLGLLFGVVAYLVLVVFLFSLHTFAGLGAIAAVVLIVAARGLWELLHPPKLEDL